jgi:hypothetical protein
MGNFSTPVNEQAMSAAAGYVHFIQRIISATQDELNYQLEQYYAQRTALAQNEGENYRPTKLKFYPKKANIKGTEYEFHYIYWGWSLWIDGQYKTQHISSENRRTGAYSKQVLGSAIKKYMRGKEVAPWELNLAYAFEVERLQPLRAQLKEIRKRLETIPRIPYTPTLDDGPVKFTGMPVETE